MESKGIPHLKWYKVGELMDIERADSKQHLEPPEGEIKANSIVCVRLRCVNSDEKCTVSTSAIKFEKGMRLQP